ncbi:MAG: hypothetical protein IPP35_01095 [Elusimicrobia bacterium]|nr:hypothetical protein [Elusimicrobiota bacterium]
MHKRMGLWGVVLILAGGGGGEVQVASSSGYLNGVARLMAGMDPGEAGFEKLTTSPTWTDHQAFFEKNWAALSKKRLDPARDWAATDVKPDPSLQTLFYPFSGPDFMNAYLFFPDCDTYVFYSLEAPGVPPSVRKLSDSDYANLLTDIRESMDDIFQRQYFITKRMMKELRTPVLRGNAPLIMIFMARMNLDILSVENVRIGSDGTLRVSSSTAIGALAKRAAANPVPGVRITFRRPEGKTQTLVYLSVDVSDKGLASHPEFLTYLSQGGTGISFMKSASYLLHGSNFSKIRASVLRSTRYLLQDDSGLPYRAFGKGGWTVTLYGRYTNAIKDFGGTIQQDLADAYTATEPARLLPFTFGYHWWDKHSNIQIAVKDTEPATPANPKK